MDREKEEKRKRGEWDYCGESGEWYWTGETEPKDVDQFCSRGMTMEEKIAFRKFEDKMMEDMERQRKMEREEKRKQMKEKQKQEMNTPLEPLPERELCKYEIIREEIIRERMEAMKKCNFFKDLNEMKFKMGIMNEVNEEREMKKKKNTKSDKKKKKTKKAENSFVSEARIKLGEENEDKVPEFDGDGDT